MDMHWWVTDSLAKVFRESCRPADACTEIELWAARNETEDAQVALHCAEKIARARFSFSNLKGPKGHSIPKQSLRGFWQWYTYVLANPPRNTDPATYLRKAPAFFPDAFLEEKEIRIDRGTTQPLWVSISVPEGTPAGLYSGKVEVMLEAASGKTEKFAINMTVHVWPFTIPTKPSLHHTEWTNPSALSDYYHLEKWGEKHWAWIEKMAGDMGQHRQDMILTPFMKLVTMIDQGNGAPSFDFSRLDRWIGIFQKAGVDWIEGEHLPAGRAGGWHGAFKMKRKLPLMQASGQPTDVSEKAMPDAQFESLLAKFYRAVYDHLKEKGLASWYVQHISDEPTPENKDSWARISRAFHKWVPSVPRIDAIWHPDQEGMFGTYLDTHCEIQVPQIHTIKTPSKMSLPNQLWCYVCLGPQGPYPNRFLDYASVRNRIIFWLCWTLKLRGFLHWGYNYWRTWGGVPVSVPVSPWTDATGLSIFDASNPLPAGDPFIVYPGRESICSSIRWEVVRKGMEDFELLRMLEDAVKRPRRRSASARKKGKELLRSVRQGIAQDPVRYTRDAGLLMQTRREAGDTISALCPDKK